MLYLNNRVQTQTAASIPPANIRPVAAIRRRGPVTFYQWRNFYKTMPEASEKIENSYLDEKKETRLDKYFLLPGRRNTITRMIDDEAIEVRRMVGTHGPIEEWERSIKTEFPIKRSFASMIGQYVPRLRPSLSSASDPENITESWSRRTKFFETRKKRRLLSRGEVKAEISEIKVDGETHKSIALISDRAEPLMNEIKRLGLTPKANTNFGAFLLS